jgi:hypothetical protein
MLAAVEVALTLLAIKDQVLLVAVMEDQETQRLLQHLQPLTQVLAVVVLVDLRQFLLVELVDQGSLLLDILILMLLRLQLQVLQPSQRQADTEFIHTPAAEQSHSNHGTFCKT